MWFGENIKNLIFREDEPHLKSLVSNTLTNK
jgi:hypothetical protein